MFQSLGISVPFNISFSSPQNSFLATSFVYFIISGVIAFYLRLKEDYVGHFYLRKFREKISDEKMKTFKSNVYNWFAESSLDTPHSH